MPEYMPKPPITVAAKVSSKPWPEWLQSAVKYGLFMEDAEGLWQVLDTKAVKKDDGWTTTQRLVQWVSPDNYVVQGPANKDSFEPTYLIVRSSTFERAYLQVPTGPVVVCNVYPSSSSDFIPIR